MVALHPTMPLEASSPPLPSVVSLPGAETDPLVQLVLTSLDDAKSEDIVAIDLHGKTSIADTMVITSGRSNTHVSAIADRLVRAIKDAGRATPRVEGLPTADWVLIDAGDVIVHIFRPEVRQFYNLEKMWGTDRPGERRSA